MLLCPSLMCADYGNLRATVEDLDAAGIGHCGEGEGALYTTESGLTVGVYAVYSWHTPSAESVAAGVRELKDAGAEIVVVSAHWGNEASYYQNANQDEVGRAAIDAGASIVFGHGPHRLEPFEKYNIGVCCKDLKPETIIEAIKYVDTKHDQMVINAKAFYDSVDLDCIVNSIVNE